MTDQRVSVTETAAINPDRLAIRQMQGLECAWCRARLFRARSIGTFRTGSGIHAEDTELWVCVPACGTPVKREP